jgi:putative ABC transport system permease protein
VKLRRLALAALRSLARNRLRSLLTALGIVIGVAAVIVMVALGQGAQRRIQREIGGLGRNMLTVFSGAGQVGGVARGAGTLATLTLDDVERLREEASLLAHVSPLVRSGVQVVAGASNWSTTIVGVSPDYLEVRDWALVEGEPFTEREERTGAKVLLLGQRVAQELFGGEPALGERVRVGRVPFRVAGVLASKGVGGGGQDLDDLVMAPVGAVLGRLTRPDAPLQIHLSVADAERMDAAAVEVQEILRASHRLREGEEDDFTIRSQADLVAAATATTETLTMLLGGVAAVSLLVGGIGIMNIMLVSVTERTREIGIRLAVGAKSRDVLLQFLLEALALTGGGALLGVAIGLGASQVFALGGRFETAPDLPSIVLASLFAMGVGLLFGLAPARRAANLDPIEALRHE